MHRTTLVALLGVAAIAGIAMLATTRQAATAAAPLPAAEISIPERLPEPPSAPAVPAVLAQAEAIVPLAYTLETVWQGTPGHAPVARQQVTRTRTRAHLALDGGRREWYFERNPVHPERVTGYLVDHSTGQIRVHDDSDLRSVVQIRGWADVVLMRFDRASLDALRPTGEQREVAGIRFAHYVAEDRAARGVVDAWWSDDALLALEWTTRESDDRAIRARVTGLTHDVDVTRVADPAARFPHYTVVDAADAGDEHH